jgi:putative PIN family toxin of toxin-antitoxin system
MRWLRGAVFEILLCPMLIDEIESVLVSRKTLRRYISQEEAETFVIMIATFGSLLSDPLTSTTESRDERDDYLIHFAREDDADIIVSGDKDLLDWVEQNPPVEAPRAFLERVDEDQE